MATFVNGSTKPGKEKVALNSAADLHKWICDRVDKVFNVEVTNETGIERNQGRNAKVDQYFVKVWTRMFDFHKVVYGKTLVAAAKRFQTELYPAMLAHREKVQGTVIQPPQVAAPVKATVIVDPVAALPAPRRLGLPAPKLPALPAPKRRGSLFDDYEDESGD